MVCTRQGSNLQPYDPKSYAWQSAVLNLAAWAGLLVWDERSYPVYVRSTPQIGIVQGDSNDEYFIRLEPSALSVGQVVATTAALQCHLSNLWADERGRRQAG